MLVLEGFDKGRENIEPVACGRPGFGLFVEISGDLANGPIVVLFIPDGAYVFHHTVSGSIMSYSLCIPTNLMRMRLNG